MLRQPKIEMILDCDATLPTPRERQISWLQFCFALLADIDMDHVSVVHNDDQETITVHLVCPNPCRCIRTLMMQIGSDDDCYLFVANDGTTVRLPLEPHAGEE